MLLRVRHTTSYAYDGPAGQLVQVLRLTPRSHDGQDVLGWSVSCSDAEAISAFTDGLGNLSHLIAERGPLTTFEVTAEGEARTADREGVVAGTAEPLPPAYFLRETPLTAPSEAIVDLARSAVEGEIDRFKLVDLMKAVRETVAYTPGETDAETTAAQAFDAGAGVCQDQAHVFIAAARALGIPARYVGGYVWEGEGGERPFASHAWAEAFSSDVGWLGLDPSNGVWMSPSHLRVATGLDYAQAAPISGRRRGVGTESLDVSGRVEAVESSQ